MAVLAAAMIGFAPVAAAAATGLAASGAGPGARVAAATALPAQATETEAPIAIAGNNADIDLRLSGVDGSTRTYYAYVTYEGQAVTDADMDISALTDDPDLRVGTKAFVAVPGNPGAYKVVITFPADGAWILQVRLETSRVPGGQINLFTELDVGGATRSHSLDTPSKQAVMKIDPEFYARYDPTRLAPGIPLSATELAAAKASGHTTMTVTNADGTTSIISTGGHGFEFMTVLWAIIHVLGTSAWGVTVFALVFANRMGTGSARLQVVSWLSKRYTLLATGGMATTLLSGMSLVQTSPLIELRNGLADDGIGLAYVLVFAAKMGMVLVAGITSIRIGRALRALPASAWQLRSVGAAVNDDDPETTQVLGLAEANAVLFVLVLACVAILTNLHHSLL